MCNLLFLIKYFVIFTNLFGIAQVCFPSDWISEVAIVKKLLHEDAAMGFPLAKFSINTKTVQVKINVFLVDQGNRNTT